MQDFLSPWANNILTVYSANFLISGTNNNNLVINVYLKYNCAVSCAPFSVRFAASGEACNGQLNLIGGTAQGVTGDMWRSTWPIAFSGAGLVLTNTNTSWIIGPATPFMPRVGHTR